jgi:hypothetical protein
MSPLDKILTVEFTVIVVLVVFTLVILPILGINPYGLVKL